MDKTHIDKIKYAIIMKVGYHVDESLDEIILRKREEDLTGLFFWGYGGVICHPIKQVRPLIEMATVEKEKVHLLMSITPSKYKSSPNYATSYSEDNQRWLSLPNHINVTGSKYAFVCKNLREINCMIDLRDYIVAIGNKKGVFVSDYLRNRVDKACSFKSQKLQHEDSLPNRMTITYVAEICSPFSVFVK